MSLRVVFMVVLMSLFAWAEPWPQLPVKAGVQEPLILSPQGSYVLLERNTDIQIWSGNTHKILTRLRDRKGSSRIAFSPDERHLVISNYPQSISCYDCSQGVRKVWEFKTDWGRAENETLSQYDVSYSPDGRYLLVVTTFESGEEGDHKVRLLDAANGRMLWEHPHWGGRRRGNIADFCFSPDSKEIFRVHKDKLQRLMSSSGELVQEIKLDGGTRGSRATSDGLLVRLLSEDGSRFVERLYSYNDLTMLRERGGEEFEVHPDKTLRWTRDANRLQVEKGGVAVYTGSDQSKLKYWVPEGGFVVSTGTDRDELYDTEGRKLLELPGHVEYLARLASERRGYEGPGALYDLVTGRKLCNFSMLFSRTLSEDGKIFAIATPRGIFLMDVPQSLKAQTAVPKKPKDSTGKEP